MLKLYAWTEKYNFGDAISIAIAEWVSGVPVCTVGKDVSRKLLCVGSILQTAKTGDVIWGSGVHPHGYEGFWKNYSNTDLDVKVLAVRGPVTRDVLIGRGIQCPEIYGDPGILLPKIYKKTRNPIKKVGIIPHLGDKKLHDNQDIIDVSRDWEHVVDEILKCEKIVSSSLHGIIIAEAYGVPAVWYRPTAHEGMLKFLDYYLSTNRIPIPKYTIEDALLADGLEIPDFQPLTASLLQAFDRELVVSRCGVSFTESAPTDQAPPDLRSDGQQTYRFSAKSVKEFKSEEVSDSPLGFDRERLIVFKRGGNLRLSDAEPKHYREHYPYREGTYPYPSVTLSVFPSGFQIKTKEDGYVIANGSGEIVVESLVHALQEEPHKIHGLAAGLGQVGSSEVIYTDSIAASILNQSTDNYFHWIMQALPSVYLLKVLGLLDKVKVLGKKFNSWQRESLNLIAGETLDVLDEYPAYSRFKCLLRASPSNYIGRNAYIPPFILHVFNDILANMGEHQSSTRKKLYVSRADAYLRRLDNEEELEAFFAEQGFEIVVPSKLGFLEQVNLFRSAEVVVGTHGAGLTNIGFAPSDCRIFEIFPGHYMDGSYFALSQLKGQTYRSWTQKSSYPREMIGTHKSWRIDMDEFRSALKIIT